MHRDLQPAGPRQPELAIPVVARPVLVDVDETASRLMYTVPTVLGMVDSGALQWVWDVSLSRISGAPSSRRELRFWLGEILAPDVQRHLSITDVIRCLIGREACQELRSVTVGHILRLRPHQMKVLVEAGEMEGHISRHSRWITRSSLESYLVRRWIGG